LLASASAVPFCALSSADRLTARILEMRLGHATARRRAAEPDHAKRVMTTHLAVADAAGASSQRHERRRDMSEKGKDAAEQAKEAAEAHKAEIADAAHKAGAFAREHAGKARERISESRPARQSKGA
jgi:hypothetical protein